VNPPAGQAFDQLSATLETRGPVVLPALLLCDFGHLAHEVERLESAGAAGLHLDVMDGRFVPQLTYGLVVVEAVRRAAKGPLEVHLMVEQPELSIEAYAKAGADILTVHLEGLSDPRRTLEQSPRSAPGPIWQSARAPTLNAWCPISTPAMACL
jgi:ribulose-phosphate 3-epimerase